MSSDATAQIAPCQAEIDKLDNTVPRPDGLIQLRQKDIPTWRAKLLAQQDNTCLVCQTKISKTDKAALDHQHGKKGVEIGYQKSGLVRGVLHDQCNRFEGVLVCCILYTLQLFAFIQIIFVVCLFACLTALRGRQGVFSPPKVLQLYRPAKPVAQPGRLLRSTCHVANPPVGEAQLLASQKTQIQPTGQAY